MHFICDLEGAEELQAHWDSELATTSRDLIEVGLDAAREGVATAQAEHAYTDRTHNLTNNAHVEQEYDGEAYMVWPEEYATFVDKGTSRNAAYPFTPVAEARAEMVLDHGATAATDALAERMKG